MIIMLQLQKVNPVRHLRLLFNIRIILQPDAEI